MGCVPSHIHDESDKTTRRREEVMAQARRQRVRDLNREKRKEWDQQRLQRKVYNIHRAEGVPEGWGIPDLGYAERRDYNQRHIL